MSEWAMREWENSQPCVALVAIVTGFNVVCDSEFCYEKKAVCTQCHNNQISVSTCYWQGWAHATSVATIWHRVQANNKLTVTSLFKLHFDSECKHFSKFIHVALSHCCVVALWRSHNVKFSLGLMIENVDEKKWIFSKYSQLMVFHSTAVLFRIQCVLYITFILPYYWIFIKLQFFKEFRLLNYSPENHRTLAGHPHFWISRTCMYLFYKVMFTIAKKRRLASFYKTDIKFEILYMNNWICLKLSILRIEKICWVLK